MAERPGDLTNRSDKLDPVSTAAGVGSDAFLEKPVYHLENDTKRDTKRQDVAALTSDMPEETGQIKAQIEETRANMGETIDAIQERLSYSNISEQVSEQVNNAIETAKENVYEATIGKAVNYMKNAGDEISRSSVVTTVRENPFPFVLIGLGAGLLAFNSFGRSRSDSRGRYGSEYNPGFNAGRTDYTNRAGFAAGSSSGSSSRSLLDTTQEKFSGVRNKVSDAASGVYEGVTSAANKTYSEAGEIAGRAYERAGEFGTKAYETYDHYLEENPVAIGAIALAVGAAVGFAIPTTRYEGELMGETRDSLISKAEDTATDLVDKAKNVATEAGKVITEEVKKEAKSAGR